MREAQECAVKNKKRATRGSPQVATQRPKLRAATPQNPVDIVARSDNQQSRGGQDLVGGISPPAWRLLPARKPAPAGSYPWEDLVRRRAATPIGRPRFMLVELHMPQSGPTTVYGANLLESGSNQAQ